MIDFHLQISLHPKCCKEPFLFLSLFLSLFFFSFSIPVRPRPSGEARTMEMLEDCGGELQEFVSTCKGVFSSLVEKHFPVPNKKTKTIDIIGEMMSTSRLGSAGMGRQRSCFGENQHSSFGRSSSPLFNGGEKRKMTEDSPGGASKKIKKDSEESDVSSSSSEDDDDDDDDDDDNNR